MANLTDSIKYLDLAGLGVYDGLIKGVITAGDQANANALNALKGTLAEDDAKTLEAINDEINGIDSAIETLNSDDTTAGSVAKSIKDAIDGLDVTANTANGQAVVSVGEVDGKITVTTGDIEAGHVTVDWGTTDPVSTTANVQAALNEIHEKLADAAEAGAVAVYENGVKVSAIAADGKTYTIKQGNTNVATINIAKDMVVSSGSVITATGSETDVPTGTTLVVGEKYVRLVIKNSADGKNIYIAVNDLYDDYTFNDSTELDFSESSNQVTAEIKTGSIAEGKLTTELQNKINSAATVVNEKTTGHVTVAVTPASGANPAQVTISENDIASANDLTAEVTRAKAAEAEIADLVGLTGVEGSKAYASNVGGANVTADINTLDSRLDAVEAFVGNAAAITSAEIQALFA